MARRLAPHFLASTWRGRGAACASGTHRHWPTCSAIAVLGPLHTTTTRKLRPAPRHVHAQVLNLPVGRGKTFSDKTPAQVAVSNGCGVGNGGGLCTSCTG
jgi:hypothetical protein